MTDALMLDMLEWLAAAPRGYPEVMEAWRSSCPRLTVWENALDRGFIVRRDRAGEDALIEVTSRGRDFLVMGGRLMMRGGQTT